MSAAVSAESPPIVVELFTSQGCSSCPSADKFLGELATDDSIVAISCHVTYWNYLGWRDTLSQDYCDSRQIFYRDSFKKRSAYTPQMVINGKYEGVGSQREKINDLIQKARNKTLTNKIGMTLIKNGTQLNLNSIEHLLSIKNPKLRIDILGLGDRRDEHIINGENQGRTLTYTNPVLVYHQINTKKIEHGLISIPLKINEDVHTWVAIANNTVSGELVAVGTIPAY